MDMFRYCLIASTLLLTACSWVGVDCDPPAILASDLARIQMRTVEQQWWQFDENETGRLLSQTIDVGVQSQHVLPIGMSAESSDNQDCRSEAPIQLTVGSGWTIEPIVTSLCEYDSNSTEHLASVDSRK